MRTTMVFTVTGPDRVGIVEEVTELLLGMDGNVETSRAMRLGGEFAMLMLVTLTADRTSDLDSLVEELRERGYLVTATETERGRTEGFPGWHYYRVQVDGADHEGIVHGIARGLSRQGITIESMDTGTSRAPVTGTPLFSMTALVAVPPDLVDTEWVATLKEAADRLNVDVAVERVEDQ